MEGIRHRGPPSIRRRPASRRPAMVTPRPPDRLVCRLDMVTPAPLAPPCGTVHAETLASILPDETLILQDRMTGYRHHAARRERLRAERYNTLCAGTSELIVKYRELSHAPAFAALRDALWRRTSRRLGGPGGHVPEMAKHASHLGECGERSKPCSKRREAVTAHGSDYPADRAIVGAVVAAWIAGRHG